MKLHHRRHFLRLSATAALMTLAGPPTTHAQTFPTRPIKKRYTCQKTLWRFQTLFETVPSPSCRLQWKHRVMFVSEFNGDGAATLQSPS
jgi:hypothetical protein